MSFNQIKNLDYLLSQGSICIPTLRDSHITLCALRLNFTAQKQLLPDLQSLIFPK